jgi:hypothetical protein
MRRNFYTDDKTEELLETATKETGASASFLLRTLVKNYIHLVIPAARIKVTQEIELQTEPKIASYVPRRQ